MAKIKIIHEREKCIGCGACAAVAPELFEMADDGKSTLKGGKQAEDEIYEKEIDASHASSAKEAERNCPADCIHTK